MERNGKRILTSDEMLEIIGKMQKMIPSGIPGHQAYAICVAVLSDIIIKTAVITDDETVGKIADDVKMRIKQYYEIVKKSEDEEE